MKLTSALLLCLLFTGCHHQNQQNEALKKFIPFTNGHKAIIISCNKCGCVIQALNDAYKKDSSTIAGYSIYGDSTCLGDLLPGIRIINTPQLLLDSMSTQWHNMLLIKNNQVQVIKTEDADQLARKLKD